MRRASLLLACLLIAPVASADALIATEVSMLSTPTDRCKAFMAANPDLVCLSRQVETSALCKEFMLQYPDAVCLKLSVARSDDLQLATLDHDLSLAKLRARHLGLTLGCGPTVSGFVTDSWSTKALPAVSCGLVYGWRF